MPAPVESCRSRVIQFVHETTNLVHFVAIWKWERAREQDCLCTHVEAACQSRRGKATVPKLNRVQSHPHRCTLAPWGERANHDQKESGRLRDHYCYISKLLLRYLSLGSLLEPLF